MRIGSFEFNMRELAGSMGDMGTLLPLAIGYMTICGMNPAGLLVMMGLANVTTGLIYRLPIPIEPMKVLAVAAIAQAWTPEKIYTSAFVMGAIWLMLGGTGAISWIARLTPRSVVRGIQISLGILLAIQGLKMIGDCWWLGVIAVGIVIVLRKNRYAPAAVVLMLGGFALMLLKGQLAGQLRFSITLPPLTMFAWGEVWPVLRDGGLAQIPLTATNAVIATSALISDYWPNRRVNERWLSLDHGVMNIISPFFGGMPLCHGAGGLAGQYYFGARTGGTNIIEGVIEIVFGLFFATSLAAAFAAFPLAILGAMMLLVGLELGKFARDLRWNREIISALATIVGSVVFNIALGFVIGVLIYYIGEKIKSPSA